MQRLGEQVRRELGRFGPQAGMADIVGRWPEAVGEDIARNAWPARIARDGALHVATSSSAWAFELNHLQVTIVERLRAALGQDAPTRLVFAPGRVPDAPDAGEPATRAAGVEPGPAERERGRILAAGIADEELRELVARAAAASLVREPDDRPL